MASNTLDLIPTRNSSNKRENLKREIVARIESGVYAPGQLIPSENSVAASMGVARGTVRQAYNELEKEGFVGKIRGKGTFVSLSSKSQKSHSTIEILGLVLPEIKRGLYPSLIEGISAGANSKHGQMIICPTDYDIDKQGNVILRLLDQKISGVAIVPPVQPTPSYHVRLLQNHKIPVVFCHRYIPDIKAPIVTWDSKRVGQLAAEALLRKGHRNIAYLSLTRYSVTEANEEGFREVIAGSGIDFPDKNVFYFTENGIYNDQKHDKIIHQILSDKNHPTAIFCNDDTMAERVYWISLKVGLKVPEDLAIVGFGDTDREGVICKKLTSVVLDESALGIKAVNILSEIQTGKRPINDSEVVMMPLKLIESETL